MIIDRKKLRQVYNFLRTTTSVEDEMDLWEFEANIHAYKNIISAAESKIKDLKIRQDSYTRYLCSRIRRRIPSDD